MLKNRKNSAFVKACRKAHVEKLNMSHENKKLIPSENVDFLIWNIPARKTCPFRTPHCSEKCYAVKAEQAYPECLPCRERNLQESMKDDFIERAVYTILDRRARSKKKWVVVRIHESGDFYNQKYANAWLEIIRRCSGERIKFIAYTKSFPYFDGVKLPKEFKLRASIWDDTKPEFIETIKRNGWNIYTAVEQFQKGDKFTRCRCSDCATCGKCWKNYKDIRCEIH